jgi:hypothetical protein
LAIAEFDAVAVVYLISDVGNLPRLLLSKRGAAFL